MGGALLRAGLQDALRSGQGTTGRETGQRICERMLLTSMLFNWQVASHLDIQPLVDITCRSIAQIMSATEAAQELRHKFGLEDPPPNIECTCGTS